MTIDAWDINQVFIFNDEKLLGTDPFFNWKGPDHYGGGDGDYLVIRYNNNVITCSRLKKYSDGHPGYMTTTVKPEDIPQHIRASMLLLGDFHGSI